MARKLLELDTGDGNTILVAVEIPATSVVHVSAVLCRASGLCAYPQ